MAKAVEEFAARLRELREKAGMTQPDVAGRAGLSLHGFTKIEYAKRDPRLTTILALARALNVKPGKLLDGLA